MEFDLPELLLIHQIVLRSLAASMQVPNNELELVYKIERQIIRLGAAHLIELQRKQ